MNIFEIKNYINQGYFFINSSVVLNGNKVINIGDLVLVNKCFINKFIKFIYFKLKNRIIFSVVNPPLM